jgi:hypothetical protein
MYDVRTIRPQPRFHFALCRTVVNRAEGRLHFADQRRFQTTAAAQPKLGVVAVPLEQRSGHFHDALFAVEQAAILVEKLEDFHGVSRTARTGVIDWEE